MLIDAHVHLDKYGDLLDDALREIERENIFTVATAMDVPSYHDLQDIGRCSALVLPTFGIHPRRAPQYVDGLSELGEYIEMSPAIGEIGLDFHWVKNSSEYPAQLKVLEYFFAAAREQKKIVDELARIRSSTPESISRLVHANFLKLIQDDPWLPQVRTLLSPS
ncbi:MAG TPA: TatD family hydrolase [Candidatus Polarisedimenticolaceae bacterium]|nr:TatD family hydrolase [Candidatus Polarisedimenticolaceae bacterium]